MLDLRLRLKDNKKCRNFPTNCPHGDDCWYLHIEQELVTEDLSNNFNCELCEENIKGINNFMKHKKNMHLGTVPDCNLFRSKKCQKNENYCWYVHRDVKTNSNTSKASNQQDFQEVLGDTPPPDQMKSVLMMVTKLFSKMEEMETKIQNIMK